MNQNKKCIICVMIKPIITYPHDTLRMIAKEIADPTNLNGSDRSLAIDLMETLETSVIPGAGLSAHQIDVVRRIFVINLEITDGQYLKQYFINPTLTTHSSETIIDWEGCLSIPNIWGHVERFQSVTCSAYNLSGEEFSVTASDFYARLLQHEMDHLNGILFIDKLKSRTYTTKELEELSFEEANSRTAG